MEKSVVPIAAVVSRKLYVRLLAVIEKDGGPNCGNPLPIVPKNHLFCSICSSFARDETLHGSTNEPFEERGFSRNENLPIIVLFSPVSLKGSLSLIKKIYAIRVPTMTTNALRAKVLAQATLCGQVPFRCPGKFLGKSQYENSIKKIK